MYYQLVLSCVSKVECYAVDIWNSVVKKYAGKNLTALANAKCKLNFIMLTFIERYYTKVSVSCNKAIKLFMGFMCASSLLPCWCSLGVMVMPGNFL